MSQEKQENSVTNQRRDNETLISGSGNGDERKGTHKEVASVGLCKGLMRGESKAEVKNDSQVSGLSKQLGGWCPSLVWGIQEEGHIWKGWKMIK